MTVECLETGPARGPKLLLAHGAGAAMDSEWMNALAERLAAHRIRVIRFNFHYMHRAVAQQRRIPPDRQPKLVECWQEVLQAYGRGRFFIGGKSLGGRIASLLADDSGAAGLVCFGYPFHAPGRPENPRIDHLQRLRTPALILQGERDPFGRPDEVAGYRLAQGVTVSWLPEGDHSFKPRKSQGGTLEQNLELAAERTATFLGEVA